MNALRVDEFRSGIGKSAVLLGPTLLTGLSSLRLGTPTVRTNVSLVRGFMFPIHLGFFGALTTESEKSTYHP